jgi:hypothetical protein
MPISGMIANLIRNLNLIEKSTKAKKEEETKSEVCQVCFNDMYRLKMMTNFED